MQHIRCIDITCVVGRNAHHQAWLLPWWGRHLVALHLAQISSPPLPIRARAALAIRVEQQDL
eukprot:573147-Pelagomonas_calceolata.AAC.8